MPGNKTWKKVVIIASVTGGILSLHYFTFSEWKYHHALYRMLFYLPLVLGCFWFGLKGALSVSLAVSTFYLPYVLRSWQGLSIEDFDKILEGTLYLAIAFVLGLLVERERKRQRELLQAERLAAMGRALSEVAHDMKTPLVAIGGFVNQVFRRLPPNDPSRKKLGTVIQETARLEAMVKNMLDFGKPVQLQRKGTDLNELVLQAMEVAETMANKARVLLKADLDASLPSLNLDVPRVKQVLLNLMSNAVQASPAGGQVLVRTFPAKGWAVLDVIDHGRGIAEKNHKRIFHPFFSTKKEGSGLGLAIVKKIVEAHGGEVSFHSNGAGGATFTVRFPYNVNNGLV